MHIHRHYDSQPDTVSTGCLFDIPEKAFLKKKKGNPLMRKHDAEILPLS